MIYPCPKMHISSTSVSVTHSKMNGKSRIPNIQAKFPHGNTRSTGRKERHSHDTENGGSRRNFIVSYNWYYQWAKKWLSHILKEKYYMHQNEYL